MGENNIPVEKEIQEMISAYEYLVIGIHKKAKSTQGRAYGGIVRAGKGKLVESIAKHITLIAWKTLGEDLIRISFGDKKLKVPIKREYVTNLKDPRVKSYILRNITKYYYLQKSDLHVLVDGNFVMVIECKAYTENAMLKRILIDFSLLKQGSPDIDCVLFQLESQLGGDYSELKDDITLGSPSTHTLLSNFDIDLHIITLLKGERKVDEPIHIAEYYKPLTEDSLRKAIEIFKNLLQKHQ